MIHAKVVWFDLSLFIINIYAPSGSVKERTKFFEELSDLLDQHRDELIILAGDFNCVLDEVKDRPLKPNSQTTLQKDQIALENLIIKHSLVDSWRHKNKDSKACTFGRAFDAKISRLDQIYVSVRLTNLVDTAEIIPHTASDHNICKLSLKTPDNLLIAKSPFRLNNRVLKHKKFQTITREIITKFSEKRKNNPSLDAVANYGHCKYTMLRSSKRYAIGHRFNIKTEIKETRTKIQEMESSPGTDLEDHKTNVRHLHNSLNELLNREVQVATLNSRTTSADTSERMTKTFFSRVKPQTQKEVITAMKTPTGVSRTPKTITETITNFYGDLFCHKPVQKDEMNTLLNTITTTVKSHDYNAMNAPISPSEVLSAIRNIASDKAPGPDGLGSEFYKTFATDLAPLLAEVYNACIEKGEIPEYMSEATIQLLFKKGDKQDIKNWRPITLLNVEYKIFTKIITERMKKCLPKILHPDQKGFVPTRRLEDAVIKASSLIDYCKIKNTPKYMILLDQEKAFDRVSREYLHAVIEKFNFPPKIKNAVKALYAVTTANISINGQLSTAVPLKSGVRQGCPLSPTLFALCIEPLGNLIRTNQNYTGISIPGVNSYNISKFADDTVFFVNDQRDHDIVRDYIRTYELGTAAKANVSKTEILPIGPNTHEVENPLQTDIKILDHRTDVRFLGVNIGNNVNLDAIWDDKIERLATSLKLWDLTNPSYEGRILALRTQALGSIWFQAKFHELPKSKIILIEKMIKNFVCKNKQRAPIKYNLMKLPRDLGGMNVPVPSP